MIPSGAARVEQLNDALKAMGMGVAFGPKADFSRLRPPPPPLRIDDVEHKTYVKVDEEGTEAAAATSVGIAAMAVMASPPPFQMVVDHPFFCAIAERRSGALLFAGVVTDSKQR
jgi:serine protease inhibitor